MRRGSIVTLAIWIGAFPAQPVGAGYYAAVRDDPATIVREVHAGDPLISALPRPGSAPG